jgi:N-glycosylase/DNA lyase
VSGVELPVAGPLDLEPTLAWGQSFRWQPDGRGRYVGVVGGDIVRLTRTPAGVWVESAPTPPGELAESLAAYLRLDDDLLAIQSRLAADPHVAAGIRAYPGLRMLRQDPWETLASFILSQVSNIPRIHRTVEALARAYGAPVRLGGTWRRTFPGPAQVAEAGERRLRRLGCGFRAPYLAAAAEAVADGRLRLDALRAEPYPAVLEALTGLVGVGDKVADCVMLFALDRPEAFPADRWVLRVLREWYALPERFSYPAIRAWAQGRFGQDAGYANHYLFWHIREGSRAGA